MNKTFHLIAFNIELFKQLYIIWYREQTQITLILPKIWISYFSSCINFSYIEVSLNHRCFPEQETLPLLLSTGWFQERIRAWIHNRTKIKCWPYGRLTYMSNKSPRWISPKPNINNKSMLFLPYQLKMKPCIKETIRHGS